MSASASSRMSFRKRKNLHIYTQFDCHCFTEGGAKGNPKQTADEEEVIPSRLDIRVGKVISVEKVEASSNNFTIYFSNKRMFE